MDGVKLIVGDKCMGMLEAVGEVFPDAKYQRCTVHFYRNIFSVVPKSKVKIVAKMLKAIHAQESKKASREKAKAVVAELRAMKLKEAAKKVEDGIEESLTYCDFPSEHWTRIRTNNVIERLNREIRRRTRVVGTFPDGNSKERKKPATAGFFLIWRGREDLNLRGAFYTPYSLSRGAPSATWVLPQMSNFSADVPFGGESGIRTHGCFHIAGFQDRCFQPLSHLSMLVRSRLTLKRK